jgi:hypothetical protein
VLNLPVGDRNLTIKIIVRDRLHGIEAIVEVHLRTAKVALHHVDPTAPPRLNPTQLHQQEMHPEAKSASSQKKKNPHVPSATHAGHH